MLGNKFLWGEFLFLFSKTVGQSIYYLTLAEIFNTENMHRLRYLLSIKDHFQLNSAF